MSEAHYRKTIGPAIRKPTPTQNPDPTLIWITCIHCSQPLLCSEDVRGVVVQTGNPNTSYYVADQAPSTFRPYPDEALVSEGIKAANETTNLALARILCSECIQPAGWKVLQRSHSHPAVNAGQFLLPVPPPRQKT